MIRIITPSQEIQNTQQVVEVFQKNLPDLIFEAAKDVADIIQDRVEGQGLATNGSPLVTPSNNPIGRYGQRHGQARQARQDETRREQARSKQASRFEANAPVPAKLTNLTEGEACP